MTTQSGTISSPIDLNLVVSDGEPKPVHADLSYSPQDPYAVRCAFHTGGSETVEWTFARSLLTEGVSHAVGDGDVQVWPACDPDAQLVWIALSSPSGEALFEARLAQVVQFLRVTYDRVPAECESDFINVDSELELLFSK